MNLINQEINDCLANLKGSGKFCSIGTADFILPQLHIKSIGEISFPIIKIQAEELIKIAHKAPFGKGMETILDTKVRSAWEIDASEIYFEGNTWTNFLADTLTKVKEDLGISDAEVSTHLYKMLIYEEGDFFLKHKDTEKEKGMFGSLVIGLPSTFTGGELMLSFDGEEKVADFSKNKYQLNYTAFYADCDHEVKPLLSGYRVCLVYNLVQHKSNYTLSALATKNHVDKLAEILRTSDNNKPFVILLGHQYTPENFSLENLKLNDRFKANVLLKAAEQINFYANLCLVTSFVSGGPKYYNDDDSIEMDEVYDEGIEVNNWILDQTPSLGNLEITEEDLIASFSINDGNPIDAENTGYMGNYGPDIIHWYHYGAVVIWSPKANVQLIQNQTVADKLKWIHYFNSKNGSKTENELVEKIITEGELFHATKKLNYDVIADWIILNNPEVFLNGCDPNLLRFYFNVISTPKWLGVLANTTISTQKYFFSEISKEPTTISVENWTSLCCLSIQDAKLKSIVKGEFTKALGILQFLFKESKGVKSPVTSVTIQNLIILEEEFFETENQRNSLAEILTKEVSREYVHYVLAPVLLEFSCHNSFTYSLLERCFQYLKSRVENKPQPPENWTREVPQKESFKKEWAEICLFLSNPEAHTLDIKRNQNERSALETAIANVIVDLKTETIKKGTPHTLRISKTQDSYKRALKLWEEDVRILEQIVLNKIK